MLKCIFSRMVLTKTRLFPLWMVRGPPESPPQVLVPPAPLVQRVEATMNCPKVCWHTALLIICRVTALLAWEVLIPASIITTEK